MPALSTATRHELRRTGEATKGKYQLIQDWQNYQRTLKKLRVSYDEISNVPIVGYVPFEENVTSASSDQWTHEGTQSRRQTSNRDAPREPERYNATTRDESLGTLTGSLEWWKSAYEEKRPNPESVEEMTHLSRTAFDAKQNTLRKLQKEQPAQGCKTILGHRRLDNSPVAQAGVKLRCFKLAKSGCVRITDKEIRGHLVTLHNTTTLSQN
ncbi:hypothetical protein V8E52_002978 [Russula decolorans]